MKVNMILATTYAILASGCSLRNDLPSCESTEAREIVEEVMKDQMPTGTKCAFNTIGVVLVMPVENEAKCQVGVKKATSYPYLDTVVTYGDDFESSFTTYIVKSEDRPEDGLSISCSFGLETKTISKKAHIEQAYKPMTLHLRIFKKDDAGSRPYEYTKERS